MQEWYIEAANSNEYHFTSPYIDLYSGERIITISKRVTDSYNNVIGVVAVDLEIEYLNQLPEWLSREEGQRVFVIDETGFILLHPEEQYQATSTGIVNITEQSSDYASLLLTEPLTVSKVENMPILFNSFG